MKTVYEGMRELGVIWRDYHEAMEQCPAYAKVTFMDTEFYQRIDDILRSNMLLTAEAMEPTEGDDG